MLSVIIKYSFRHYFSACLLFIGCCTFFLPFDKALSQNIQRFVVTVHNKESLDPTVEHSPLAQGFWIVHDGPAILFSEGKKAFKNGLEQLAEDGDAKPAFRALKNNLGVSGAGVFPEESLLPGQSTSFSVEALPGQNLTIAIMMAESNDKFFAPTSHGISLFDRRGHAIKGNFSRQLFLWDAGTEQDEEPGIGLYQLLRQKKTNAGADQNAPVLRFENAGKDLSRDGFFYPSPRDHISLEITPD